MPTLMDVFWRVFEESGTARAHFHTWWALRNLALPDFYNTMNDKKYVDFFQAANSGNFKLIFISLAKIFDRDTRVTGFRLLKQRLASERYIDLPLIIDKNLDLHKTTIDKVLKVRHESVAHSQADLPREKVYGAAGITANEIRALIDATCETVNYVANAIGVSNVISNGKRHEKAVIEMLKTLEKGRV